MTAVEMGREIRAERPQLLLSDAMAESLGEVTRQEDTETGSRVPLRRVGTPTIVDQGIRFQRCGGGRRIIRKQRGGA